MKPIETYYIVVLHEDGTLSTTDTLPELNEETLRPATIADIYTSSQQLVKEIDQQALVTRIVEEVAKLNPAPPAVSDRMKEALKSRGIDPESVTITN